MNTKQLSLERKITLSCSLPYDFEIFLCQPKSRQPPVPVVVLAFTADQ